MRLITGPFPSPSGLRIAQPLALPAQEGWKPRRDLEGPGEGIPGPGKTDGVPLWTSVHSPTTLSLKLLLDPTLAACLLRFHARAWEARRLDEGGRLKGGTRGCQGCFCPSARGSVPSEHPAVLRAPRWQQSAGLHQPGLRGDALCVAAEGSTPLRRGLIFSKLATSPSPNNLGEGSWVYHWHLAPWHWT